MKTLFWKRKNDFRRKCIHKVAIFCSFMYATLLCEAELSQEDASGEGWGAFCGGVVFLHSSFVGGSDGWMVHG